MDEPVKVVLCMKQLGKNMRILLEEIGNPKRFTKTEDRLKLYQTLAETIQAMYHTGFTRSSCLSAGSQGSSSDTV
jgi:hypothetical protein